MIDKSARIGWAPALDYLIDLLPKPKGPGTTPRSRITEVYWRSKVSDPNVRAGDFNHPSAPKGDAIREVAKKREDVGGGIPKERFIVGGWARVNPNSPHFSNPTWKNKW